MNFRRSLIASACFHLFLLLVGLITFPSAMSFQTEAIASIPVDLISEDPQVKGAKNAPKMETPQVRASPTPTVQPDDVKPVEDKKPVEPKTAPELPQESETAPPEEKKVPEKAEKKPDEIDPEGLLKKIEEAKKEEAKKKADEKKKIAEEKKKADAERLSKQSAKFDADKISNLLNKQDGAQAPKTERGEEQKQASLGNPKGEGVALTQSQQGLMRDMIEKQILPCWSMPPGVPEDMIIEIQMNMNPDGSLNGRPQIANTNSHPAFRAAADAAVRAVLRCAPLKLPAEWYAGENGWKEIGYAFNKQH